MRHRIIRQTQWSGCSAHTPLVHFLTRRSVNSGFFHGYRTRTRTRITGCIRGLRGSRCGRWFGAGGSRSFWIQINGFGFWDLSWGRDVVITSCRLGCGWVCVFAGLCSG